MTTIEKNQEGIIVTQDGRTYIMNAAAVLGYQRRDNPTMIVLGYGPRDADSCIEFLFYETNILAATAEDFLEILQRDYLNLTPIITSPALTEIENSTAGTLALVQGFETLGMPMRPAGGTSFSISDRATSFIVAAAAGSNRLTHLFRVKPGSGTVSIPNFLFSFQSLTNDDFSIEVSLSPTLSAAVTDAMFSDVHPSSKMQILRPGINTAPAGLTITGYNPAVGGRLLLSKYGRQNEVVDSSLLTRAVIPDNTAVTYAISVVAMSASMDLRGIVNWSELQLQLLSNS